MTPEDIANDAISKLNKKITDEIFSIIQDDRKLMQKYLRAVEEHGLDTLNKAIGARVKAAYHLEDDDSNDDRENDPISTLIQSHQRFK